jgi:hypothetical protein
MICGERQSGARSRLLSDMGVCRPDSRGGMRRNEQSVRNARDKTGALSDWTYLERIMLKIANVDDARIDKLGALTAHVVEQALASGLTWDEAIVAFGIAAKAIAARAADQGVGTMEQCAALAERRLKSGMDQGSNVLQAWLG